MSNGSDWRRFGITTTIDVVTILIGFIQFGSTSALSVRQPFVEHQTKLCLAASENAARLASTRNPETWAKAREEFWMLYWGPLAMVEDVETTAQSRVEGAMVEFGRELSTVPSDILQPPGNKLEHLSLNIAHACRDLIVSKWSVGLLGWFRRP